MSLRVTGLMLILLLCAAIGAVADELQNLTNIGALPYLRSGECVQISSYDREGGGIHDYRPIDVGKTLVLADVTGPGCIVNFQMTLSSAEPQVLRTLLLRMYWDGETSPSVECPIGDFFGVGFGRYVPHTSLLIGETSGGFWSYFPMPFAKSARVEIVNQGKIPCIKLFYRLEYRKLDKLEGDLGYFHAQWRRENPTTDGQPYTILEAVGRGQFVGCVLSMQGLTPKKLGFMEGNELVWLDGETEPSWIGTGTEDYFLGGWYFDRGPFSAPYHALTIKDVERARISAYRLHVPDAMPFRKSIKVAIEHGRKNAFPADYSSVAYWYQAEPHSAAYSVPGAEKRLVDDYQEPVPIPGRIDEKGRRIKVPVPPAQNPQPAPEPPAPAQ